VSWDVSQEVHRPADRLRARVSRSQSLTTEFMRYSLIEVVDSVDLFSDEVVQSVGSARKEQAVTDPLDRLDAR
jgi:hypothetical protein